MTAGLIFFGVLALAGWLVTVVHAVKHRGKDWLSVWISPFIAFAYAREYGLWNAVLLQVIGIAGLALLLIIKSF